MKLKAPQIQTRSDDKSTAMEMTTSGKKSRIMTFGIDCIDEVDECNNCESEHEE